MSTLITDACTNCGVCIHSCPNDGISKGLHKVVLDATLCTECVGFFASEQCIVVCPVDACVPDPDNVETEAAMFERAKKIHVNLSTQLTLSHENSHFRKTDAPKWWQRWSPSTKNSLQNVSELEDA